MNETKTSPLNFLVPALFGLALLNSLLLILRAALENVTATLILYYACSLLSLFVTMVGMGAAMFYLSKMMCSAACRMLLITEGASLLPLLVAAVRTAFAYPDYFTDALVIECLSAFGNTLLMLAIHLFLLLLCWLLFFKRQSTPPLPQLSPKKSRLALANLTVVAVLFVYQVIAETIETVDFLTTYWPNVYRNEIGTIIFSYLYILVSLALGYFLLYITEALLQEDAA